MAEHTPTTEEVVEFLRAADRLIAHKFSGAATDAVEAFHRWLAAHDAEVRGAAVEFAAVIADQYADAPGRPRASIESLAARDVAARIRRDAGAGVVAEEPEWEYGFNWVDRPYIEPHAVALGADEDITAWAKRVQAEVGEVRLFQRTAPSSAGEWVPVKQEGAEPSGLLVSHLVGSKVADAHPEREDADQPQTDAEPVPERAVHPPRDDEHEEEQRANEQVPVELHTDDSTPDGRHTGMKREGADSGG
jgi:hypothetical protein